MNTIIYGRAASGKSLVAQLLLTYYKNRGEKAIIIDDDHYTTSFKDAEKIEKEGTEILLKSRDVKKNHTIVTTQAYPDQIYGFYNTTTRKSLYNYFILVNRT